MNKLTRNCSFKETGDRSCSSTSACNGWGCRLLKTPINEIPTTDQEKAKLFIKVYREAKQKGVLECPHYRSSIIDEVLENIGRKISS